MGLNGEALQPAIELIRSNGFAPVYRKIENPIIFRRLQKGGLLEFPGFSLDVHSLGLALFAGLSASQITKREKGLIRNHSGNNARLLNFIFQAISDGVYDRYEPQLSDELNILGWVLMTCYNQREIAPMLAESQEDISHRLVETTRRIWELSSPKTRSLIQPAKIQSYFEKKSKPHVSLKQLASKIRKAKNYTSVLTQVKRLNRYEIQRLSKKPYSVFTHLSSATANTYFHVRKDLRRAAKVLRFSQTVVPINCQGVWLIRKKDQRRAHRLLSS